MTTSTFARALAATLATTLALAAGAASAENTFQLDQVRSTTSKLVLNNLQADEVGTVEVYAYNKAGMIDRFLGLTQVQAGANGDLEVALNQPSNARLQILLSNGNRAVSILEVREPLTN